MADLKIIDNNDGGDLVQSGNDYALVEGWSNMVYLGLFGGNVEASTKGAKLPNEQAFDFWGNNLLMPNNSSIQFNSETERTLLNVALNSAGRKQIEEAAKKDLEFMQEFGEVSVSTAIISTDRVQITITVKEPGNLQDKQFIFIWDATKQEIT